MECLIIVIRRLCILSHAVFEYYIFKPTVQSYLCLFKEAQGYDF